MPDPASTPRLYAARPTLRVDGEDRPDLAGELTALLVEETTDGLYRCEFTVANWGPTGRGVGFLHLDRDALDFGKTVEVSAGSGDGAGVLFSGRIGALEAHYPRLRAPQLTVLAEDRLQDLRMTRRTRTFEDVSDRDVIEQIASGHSLRTDLDLEGPTYPVLAQVNQSDLAFIRDRARAVDAEVWIESDTLFAHARANRTAEEFSLRYGQGLHDLSVLADLAGQRTTLAVSGWDVSAKSEVVAEAAEGAVQRELNGFESGASVLEAAFGARVERIVHLAPFSRDEAQTLANAHYRTIARRFLRGRGTAEGDARLRVGARLTLEGLGPLFGGAYYVSAVRHTFDDHGFRTHFEVERPGLERL